MATTITPAVLKARYPEFTKATTAQVQGAIDLAVTEISEASFSSMYNEAVLHHACNTLFNSASGRPMQYDNKDNVPSPYLKIYLELEHRAGISYNFMG